MHICLRVQIIEVVNQALYLLGETGLKVEHFATLHRTLLKDAEVKTGHDSKVAASAFKSDP
jgi:flagellar biogenesis protein FliO